MAEVFSLTFYDTWKNSVDSGETRWGSFPQQSPRGQVDQLVPSDAKPCCCLCRAVLIMSPSKLSLICNDISLGDSFSPSLRLSVAEVFLLPSLAEARLFTTEEADFERIHVNSLLEMKTSHPQPVLSTENFTTKS